MQAICLHDKDTIRALMRPNLDLHVFSVGDLDDFYWPYTTWYALDRERSPVALLYGGGAVPTLLAVDREPADAMAELLRAIRPLLPRRFYAHFSAGLAGVLADEYQIRSRDMLSKMALHDRSRLDEVETSEVVQLLPVDQPELEAFYRVSHPENWFNPRMLATGYYYGIRRNPDPSIRQDSGGRGGGELASVAGIHVYAPQEGVAALGNVATRPSSRGQGLARAVCAKLCRELLRTVDYIGLHVKADNSSAIALYERLGFTPVAAVEACMMETRPVTSEG
jgi:ribosomal protein S18 acetylase RimI-like enzyme